MSDKDKEPGVVMQSPPTNRRKKLTVMPIFKDGTPEANIPSSSEGLSGIYTVKYALSIPGREFYFRNVDLSDLTNSGESQIVLPDADDVRLWNTNIGFIRDAHLITDENRILTTATLIVDADNFEDAERKAHNFLMPFLSWLSYGGDVGVDIKACEIYENNTETRRWILNALGDNKSVSWIPPNDLNLTQIKPELRKLQAAYREALNATNQFYKFLCFWKVIEGSLVYRTQRERTAKRANIAIAPSPIEQIPLNIIGSDIHPQDASFFTSYLGKDFLKVRESMRDILRNAIAHLIPNNLVLDSDDYDDVSRCEKAVPVIKYIARNMLANEIAQTT